MRRALHREYLCGQDREGKPLTMGDTVFLFGEKEKKIGVFMGVLNDWGYAYAMVALGPDEWTYWMPNQIAKLTKWSLIY